MGKTADKLNPDFIISTGDNFYEDGLTGTDDPVFAESFTNIYTAPSLQKQWYSGDLISLHTNTKLPIYEILPLSRKVNSARKYVQFSKKRVYFRTYFF